MKFLTKCALRGFNLIQRATKAKTIGVRALIFNENNEVLLVKHTYRPGWHTPGGGVNAGESPTDAVIREVKEETGLIISCPQTPFSIYLNRWNGLDDYPILYVIKQQGGQPIINDPLEIKDVGWFNINALPEDTTEKTRIRIEEALGRKLVSPHW